MHNRLLIAVVICVTAPVHARAATFTINGIGAFDQSLGTLTKATVSIDILERELLVAVLSAQTIPEHHHTVSIPAIQIGNRLIEFPAVPTSVAPASLGHNHHFDPPPVSETYLGGDLEYFQPNVPYLYPFGFFVQLEETSEAGGHKHGGGQFLISGLTEVQTTFEFTPVPEPATWLTLVTMFTVLHFLDERRRL